MGNIQLYMFSLHVEMWALSIQALKLFDYWILSIGFNPLNSSKAVGKYKKGT